MHAPAPHWLPTTDVTLDPDQQGLVRRLTSLDIPARPDGLRGLYVHGGVGRGKTWLCGAYFDAQPESTKLRVHFHGFFRRLHAMIWQVRSSGRAVGQDVVEVALAELLDGVELLYFDEFHVHDSGDAILLTRTLDAIFDREITLLLTSNYAPDKLMPHPNFHDLFEPAISLLERHLEVVVLGGETDYRRAHHRASRADGFSAGHWIDSSGPAQLALAGLRRPEPGEQQHLHAGGHSFTAQRASDGEVWFDFDELCERTTSTADLLAWAADFDVWVIDSVPVLAQATPQARQRFSNLVDVLADHDATLHVVSRHSPAVALSGEGEESALSADAERTISRLSLLRTVA